MLLAKKKKQKEQKKNMIPAFDLSRKNKVKSLCYNSK